jgi:hypothetical protein
MKDNFVKVYCMVLENGSPPKEINIKDIIKKIRSVDMEHTHGKMERQCRDIFKTKKR